MRSDARIAALIELVDKAVNNPEPADNMLENYFRARRFIGSGDRRFLRDAMWDVLRHRYALEHKAGSTDARRMVIAYLEADCDLDTLFTGSKYAPASVQPEELKFNRTEPPPEMSAFLLNRLKDRFDTWREELAAFNRPARFDLRANILKGGMEYIKEQTKAAKSPLAKLGLYFERNFNITQTDAYKKGLIDIQDEGSQLVCEFCEPKPGDRILDMCAGAGGKSLTLAILMGDKGSITAYDKYPARMKDLLPRAERSGISIIKPDNYEGKKYDLVLIDAPCSGSGTIRRNVDRKWKITPEVLTSITAVQDDILQKSAGLSDRIVYATCSFIKDENEARVEMFLRNNQDFAIIKEDLLSPYKTNTDSFYMCLLERKV